MNKAELVRSYFDAFQRGDRERFESTLDEGFTFTSPYDDRIGRAAYFERCWPNRDRLRSLAIEVLADCGEHVFVMYLTQRTDGLSFRNTELFTFRGDRLASVQVFFGATYRDGIFVRP